MNQNLKAQLPERLRDSWEFVRQLEGGGQSAPLLLKRNSDGFLGVLRVLTRQRPVDVERQRREIEVLSNYNHPNIMHLVPQLVKDEG